MDSRHLTARFLTERQALTQMDHPHIAHVLDAGQTNDSRTYFLLDLVDGPVCRPSLDSANEAKASILYGA